MEKIVSRRLRLLPRFAKSLLLIFENNANECFSRFLWFIKKFLVLFTRLEISLAHGYPITESHHCVHVHSRTHWHWVLGDSHACSSTPAWNLPTVFHVGTRPAMRNARCAIHYGFLEGAFHPPGGSFKGCTPCVYACWKDDPCCSTWARVGGRAGLSHPRGGDFAGWVNRL